MAMRSEGLHVRLILAHEDKQIYWDLLKLNYDVKLMWIEIHVLNIN
jgi:hypothetical protein